MSHTEASVTVGTQPGAASVTATASPATAPVTVGGGAVSFADVVAVARHDARIVLDPAALVGVATTRAIIDGLASDVNPHYGISTGFGALASTFITSDRRAQLQASLVRSHAAGSGPEVEREVVRALMFLRLKTLASGRTGIRPVVAQTMAALLNAGITPVVREFGSLGCSGDLVLLDAPSHLHLAYRPGVPLVRSVFRAGARVR